MKKIEELRNSISDGNTDKAIELCDELYNNLRDFSQCIDIVETNGNINIKLNNWTAGKRTKELKIIIQKWVGGH